MPHSNTIPPFEYVRNLKREEVERRLQAVKLSGLADMLVEGIEGLKKQSVGSSAALNDKFQASGKFQMSYGSLSLFYGGLESLLGPPQMAKDPQDEDSVPTLIRSMENEHCQMSDSDSWFDTSNGMTTKSKIEWEFLIRPRAESIAYPERKGMREDNPQWCRVGIPLDALEQVMEVECNVKLRKEGHSEMIKEELAGGRLYTGPMYAKYNSVLRAKSDVEYLKQQNKETTTQRLCMLSIRASSS